MVTVTDEMVETYQRDGVVLVRGLWADWVAMLQAGIARNMAQPTHQMATLKPGEPGSFFDDYFRAGVIPHTLVRWEMSARKDPILVKGGGEEL